MDVDRIQKVLRDDCALDPARPLLAGVSGGPDSLCLLYLLKQLGYPVIAAHFNHGLREQAREDAGLARSAAGRLGAPFVYGEASVADHARDRGLTIEEAARALRYRFLFDEARKAGAQAVAVGHTADDQVETVLMHFLRGAGLSGLRGMRPCALAPEWDPAIPLVRPLLGLWREETVECCRAAGLDPAFDLSNLDPSFSRNRVRLELIPALESYNPQVKEAILRLSEAAAGDYQVVEAAVARIMSRALVEEGGGFVVLDLDSLRGLPRGLLRGVLRGAVARLRPGLRDLDFDAVERAAAFVEQPSRSLKTDLAVGISLAQGGGQLIVYEQDAPVRVSGWPQLQEGRGGPLTVPGLVSLGGGWVVAAEWTDLTGGERPWLDVDVGLHAWLDAACLDVPLEVRARRPGDRFAPLGMDGHSLKLSDYFVNLKLPQLARERWPLVCSREEIVWVPGFRPAHPCRVTPNTLRAVHLWLERER